MQEDHLIDLQSRLAFQEEAIEALNQAVNRQQQLLDKQTEQIKHLQQLMAELKPSPTAQTGFDEKPPHY